MASDVTNDEGAQDAGASSALSEIQRAQVEHLLRPLCVVPPHVANKVRKDLRFTGASVILFESRPRFDARKEWMEHPVAKFVYVKRARTWRLYCQMSDLRWHGYAPLPEAPEVERLVSEVARDPTGIFWG
jgi:hypothetical protein